MPMEKMARPGRAKWRVIRKADDVFEVRNPEGEVYGCYPTLNAAAAAQSHGQRRDDQAARRMTRSCMCCQKPFESEGIHNRMCTFCRGQGEGLVPYAVSSGSRGGRKAAR